MKKTDSGIVYSATDLSNFVDCEHVLTLDLRVLDEPLPRSAGGGMTELLQSKGMDHETAYLERLHAQYERVVDVNEIAGPKGDKQAATLRAMRDGADIVYQAALGTGQYKGFADFLRRVERPSALGGHAYEVLDTKLSRSPKGRYLVQLCFYSELVEDIQQTLPPAMGVVLGSGEEVSYRTADYIHYFKSLKRRFADRVALGASAGTYPHPCDHCADCHWKDLCEKQRKDDDHLSQVANISKIQIKRLNAAGIGTLKALASCPEDKLPQGTKIPLPTLKRLRHQAHLQDRARVEGHPIYEKIDWKTAWEEGIRGFERLPKPDPGDLFFDMEGDPMEPGGLEYLFGLAWNVGGKTQFKSFWAHDRKTEKSTFEAFIDFVTERLRRYPDAHIYHYAPYEKTALKRLMSVHATREVEVDDLLRRGKLVDLYQVVRESIRVSEPRYSIKNIEHFYMPARTGEVTNAVSSVVSYEKWRETHEQSILDEIEKYNWVDLESTLLLRDWLLGIAGDAVGASALLAGATEEKTKSEGVLKHEERLREYSGRLLGGLAADRTTWGVGEKTRELIYLLLDFYRREAKPQWWALFERKTMTYEERLEDVECIAGASFKGSVPVKRSIAYTYQYPDQETKLKTGDKCVEVDSGIALGEISVDDVAKTVTFKIGASREAPPKNVDIGQGGPIDSSRLMEAVFRYADGFLASAPGNASYAAITAFLRRDLPVISGRGAGPIVPEGADSTASLQATIEGVCNLDSSYLFIQGPPGAGKTYTGSHLIVELMRRGKKVGVMSNSHKAVNNLLKAVENVARERGVTFSGSKKSNKDDETNHIQGVSIKDHFDNASVVANLVSGGHLLAAGTAWLFADEGMDQALDYLFIDEAGQVSLANLVAAGTSAKNIVLLGDQMQLSQPIQGAHPGESGLSILDYLLEGNATIAPERGVFLGTTWRMHPDICGFISEAVYDGRLRPENHNAKRRLILGADHDPSLKESGIGFVPVNHEGCSQYSDEEVARVLAIYQSLLKQSYTDAENRQAPVTSENILVVAPYNMQIERLKTALGPTARLGTVDKFQGQEAEVVILSMATSSAEYLPRNIEFLFSKNRLNVALSRAKCLSILVANPALLNVPCRTPEQMALVNTLCWATEAQTPIVE